MEKEFIPYSEALALKELGFDEPCLSFYFRGEALIEMKAIHTFKEDSECIKAPLYQQAFRWLWNKTGKYIIPIQKNDKEWLAIGIVYKTYEEAELECLKKLIEIVKNK